jgi:hypothetical protein
MSPACTSLSERVARLSVAFWKKAVAECLSAASRLLATRALAGKSFMGQACAPGTWA